MIPALRAARAEDVSKEVDSALQAGGSEMRYVSRFVDREEKLI